MFDNDDRMAVVDEPMQQFEQELDVSHMQSDCWFLQQIESRFRLPHFAKAFVLGAPDSPRQFRRQFQSLRFAAAQSWAGLSQFEVTKSSIDQERERARNLRICFKKSSRFFDRHFHDIPDRFFVVENFERLRVVPFPPAILARHITARQKIHFQLNHTLAGTGLATPAFGIEGKPARTIATHAGDRQLGIEVPDLVEYFNVSPRRRPGSFPNR